MPSSVHTPFFINRNMAGVTRGKYSPSQIYSGVKLSYADFTSPTPESPTSLNTRELLPRELFYYPWNVRQIWSLAGHKTPPSVVARLLHAVASDVWHEKDVPTSPEEHDQRSRG